MHEGRRYWSGCITAGRVGYVREADYLLEWLYILAKAERCAEGAELLEWMHNSAESGMCKRG